MKRMSSKRARKERELRKVEAELDMLPGNQRCYFYPLERKREYHHIIPKSESFNLIAEPGNLLPVGGTAHAILDQGTISEIMGLPRIHDYLAKMLELNEGYYNRFIHLRLTK